MKVIQQIWLGDSADLCARFHVKKNIKTVIADPPFGTDNLSNSAVTPEGKKMARKIANDSSTEVATQTFERVMRALIPGMKDNSDIYIFTSYQVLAEWIIFTDRLLKEYNFARKAILIWRKNTPGMGDLNTSWGMGSEFILYFKRGSWTNPGTRRNNVIDFPRLNPKDLIHPHQKPEGLLEILLFQSTIEGDLVVDPFGGSGSLAKACRNLNRSGVSIEVDKNNYDLAQESFQNTSNTLL